MLTFEAPSDMTLLDLLALSSPDCSRTTLRYWIETGRVTIENQEIKRAATLIKKGQKIVVGKKRKFIKRDAEVLFEDDHIIVIDKPAGLLSVATDSGEQLSLHKILKRRITNNDRIYPVHRLDRDTSGVLVFAYTQAAREKLKGHFARHDIDREYAAVVHGKVDPSQGTWQSYLVEDANFYVKTARSSTEGRLAITHFSTLSTKREFTLLHLKLETGKKNQIRVHSAEAGHPVAGDKKYGLKHDQVERLCLHAFRLGFLHPITQKRMVFTSAIPELFFKLGGTPKNKPETIRQKKYDQHR